MARIDWSREPLGKVPDAAIARRLGCAVSSVRGARLTRRIEAYSKPLEERGTGEIRSVRLPWSELEAHARARGTRASKLLRAEVARLLAEPVHTAD